MHSVLSGKHLRVFLLLFLLPVLGIVACGPNEQNIQATVTAKIDAAVKAVPTPVPTATVVPTPTPQPASTPQPTATPQPSPTPQPTATPQPPPTPQPTATPPPRPPPPQPTPTPTPSVGDVVAKAQHSIAVVEVPAGFSTGFYLGDGWLLTAEHSIRGETQIKIKLDSGQIQTTGTLTGWNKTKDVAVIKLASNPAVPALKLRTTERKELGRSLILLGYALTSTGDPFATVGVVSRYYNWAGGVGWLIESDAFATNGSSGSPALDQDANAIGMLRGVRISVSSSGEKKEGTQLIVTSDEILGILDSLKAGGKFD